LVGVGGGGAEEDTVNNAFEATLGEGGFTSLDRSIDGGTVGTALASMHGAKEGGFVFVEDVGELRELSSGECPPIAEVTTIDGYERGVGCWSE